MHGRWVLLPTFVYMNAEVGGEWFATLWVLNWMGGGVFGGHSNGTLEDAGGVLVCTLSYMSVNSVMYLGMDYRYDLRCNVTKSLPQSAASTIKTHDCLDRPIQMLPL